MPLGCPPGTPQCRRPAQDWRGGEGGRKGGEGREGGRGEGRKGREGGEGMVVIHAHCLSYKAQ